MIETMQTNNDVELIRNALLKKSKSTFKYYKKRILEQAQYFTIAYRDFIYKIISSSQLKLSNQSKEGFARSLEDGEVYSKLNRKQDVEVVIDVNDVDTLPHELGHAIDLWFGRENALTRTVLIEENKTLYDIFTSEFNEKQEDLYKLVMNEYKELLTQNINKEAFDILMNNIEKYRLLNSIPIDKKNEEVTKRRNQIQKELYEVSFVETYYNIFTSAVLHQLNHKYSPILDALSSKHCFDYLLIDHHKAEYYERNKYLPVEEFFANMFAAKVTSKHVLYDYVIKYLPKSFNAFEKLFVIVYDHIQNNKRFVDVKIRRR